MRERGGRGTLSPRTLGASQLALFACATRAHSDTGAGVKTGFRSPKQKEGSWNTFMRLVV